MVKEIHEEDQEVQEKVCQVIHVPVVGKVVIIRVAIIPLNILTLGLIEHEEQAVAKEWVVKGLEFDSIMDAILQSIEQKAHYTYHVAHERQELCPKYLFIVLVPIAF